MGTFDPGMRYDCTLSARTDEDGIDHARSFLDMRYDCTLSNRTDEGGIDHARSISDTPITTATLRTTSSSSSLPSSSSALVHGMGLRAGVDAGMVATGVRDRFDIGAGVGLGVGEAPTGGALRGSSPPPSRTSTVRLCALVLGCASSSDQPSLSASSMLGNSSSATSASALGSSRLSRPPSSGSSSSFYAPRRCAVRAVRRFGGVL